MVVHHSLRERSILFGEKILKFSGRYMNNYADASDLPKMLKVSRNLRC